MFLSHPLYSDRSFSRAHHRIREERYVGR